MKQKNKKNVHTETQLKISCIYNMFPITDTQNKIYL